MLRSFIIPTWTLAVMLLSSGKICGTASLPTDSLEQIIHRALADDCLDTSHFRIIGILFHRYRDSLPDKARQYCRLFPRITDPVHPEKGQALMHLCMGCLHADSGDLETAMDEFFNSLDLHLRMPAGLSLAFLYKEIGKVHYRVGLYQLAQDHYRQALLTLNGCGPGMESDFLRAESHNLTGQAYLKRQMPDSALKHFQTAENLLPLTADRETLWRIRTNIGWAYSQRGDLSLAEESHRTAAGIFSDENGSRWEAISLTHIGELYASQKNWARAKEFYEQSLRKFRENGETSSRLLVVMGKLYRQMNSPEKAISSLENAVRIARQKNRVEQLATAYALLSEILESSGRYREALAYSRKHNALTDSLNRLDLARMEVRKILERKNSEISSLENEKKLSQKVLVQQKIIRNILIAVTVLGILAFLIIYNRYRAFRKAHAEISRQKKELDFLLTELGHKNRQLEASIHTRDTLFAIIGHDLKNPFNTLLGFAELLHENYASYTEEERKAHILRIRNAAEHLLQLLDNLLQWSSLQQDRMDPSPAVIYLYSLFEEILPVFKPQAEAKRIRLETHIPEDIRVRADHRMVSVVLRNLLYNALKFTGSGGRIRVSAVAQKKQVLLEVQDTGVGIPESHQKNLFSAEGTVRTKGTDGETGTGLGLYLCRQFVEKNGGKIWVKSRTGQGSSFYLTLPAE
ncbi:MAG: ATP-binding protein [Bacteroidales bacterium]